MMRNSTSISPPKATKDPTFQHITCEIQVKLPNKDGTGGYQEKNSDSHRGHPRFTPNRNQRPEFTPAKVPRSLPEIRPNRPKSRAEPKEESPLLLSGRGGCVVPPPVGTHIKGGWDDGRSKEVRATARKILFIYLFI